MLSEQASAMQAITGFSDLPSALHLQILSFLPLVERVRFALVARSWAALLAEPAFWAALRFDGASEGSVDDDTLQQLTRRAGGRLRALDVSGLACAGLTTRGLLAALSSDGLGLALESLRTWAPADPDGGIPPSVRPRRLRFDVTEAAALAAACPALASAAVEVGGSYVETAAALHALPVAGEKRVAVRDVDFADGPNGRNRPALCLSALAEWASAALGASPSIAELQLPFRGEAPLAASPDAVRAEQAAARLAAALASPERGLRGLCFDRGRWSHSSIGETPLLASLCRALTAESPLTELILRDCKVTGAGAAQIAAALAPGRSRLRALSLSANDFADGAVGLFAALGTNTTLTYLDLAITTLDAPDAAATLAASLRSNSTLRTLNLLGSDIGSAPGGVECLLSALHSTSEAPSLCSLTSLDISHRDLSAAECAALAAALAAPSCRLEELSLQFCNTLHGATIARGLEGAGAASRPRFLDLSGVGLNDTAVAALSRTLAAQGLEGALRELRLRRSGLGPSAAARIAEGLRVNSTLETLDLGFNEELGPEGAAAIVRSIAGPGGTASRVTDLSLAACGLDNAGAAAILEAGLGRSAALTELDLCGNVQLGESGWLALAHWAAARFGVAPEDPPTTGEGAQGGPAPPDTAGPPRVPDESGEKSRPSPLTIRITRLLEAGAKNAQAMASIGRIVQRANVAAAAAGWRYGRGRNALVITL